MEALLPLLFQAHPWHGMAPRAGKDTYNAYIEMVPTDTVKYELNKETGHLCIDRPQQFSSQCPTLYGLVPQTLCGPQVARRAAERCKMDAIEGDNDPIDVCVITEKTTAHGDFLCRVRPIGGLRMIDGNEADDKIIAVLEGDLAYGEIEDIANCPRGVVDRLHHYFLSYKRRPDKPGHQVHIAEIYGRDEALEMLERSIQDYRDYFGDPRAKAAELWQKIGV